MPLEYVSYLELLAFRRKDHSLVHRNLEKISFLCKPHSHPDCFTGVTRLLYWGHQCSRTSVPANRMQASNRMQVSNMQQSDDHNRK